MAGKTECGVLLFQELPRYLFPVTLVTVVAGDRAQLVNASFGLEEGRVLLVAAQAGPGSNLGVGGFEREGKAFLALRIGMFFSRTVAGLTSLLFIEHDLGVRVPFCEPLVEVFVTRLTGLGPHIPFGFHPLLAKSSDTNEGYQYHEGK